MGDVIHTTSYKLGTDPNQVRTFYMVRKILIDLDAKSDLTNNTTPNTTMWVNSTPYSSLPQENLEILGGTQSVCIVQYPPSDIVQFYKWDDGSLNTSNNFYVDSKAGIVANFKTKYKSTTPFAIGNSSQTKALRDTNNVVNQIHESMGGIFYSRSTDDGNSFSKEEFVNAGAEFLTFFPNDKSANNNSCPSICELRKLIQWGNPFSSSNGNINIGATWQRYNESSGKIEIKAAIRNYNYNNNLDWRKYGTAITYPVLNNGVVTEFNVSNPDYKSKPEIFASWLEQGSIEYPYYYLILIPHLEPTTNGGNKIVVSARCKNYNGYDEIKGITTNEFIIDEGNITDFSVTAEPTRHNYINPTTSHSRINN